MSKYLVKKCNAMTSNRLKDKLGSMFEQVTEDASGISFHENFIILKECHFIKDLDLMLVLNEVQLKNILFTNCLFSESVDMFHSHSDNLYLEIDYDIVFHDCRFEKKVSFSGLSLKKGISFTLCTFKGDFFVNWSQFGGAFLLSGTTFENKVSFDGSKFDYIYFFSKMDDHTIFRANVSFSNAEINDARFWNMIFYGDVLFVNTKFNCPVYFNNTLFTGALVFGEQGTLGRIEIKESIYLDGAEVKQLSLYNMVFEHYVSLNNTKIENVDISNTLFSAQYLSLSGTQIHNVNNEYTARVLKNEALRGSNGPIALQMKAKELDFYYCSLGWRKNLFEKFPLWLMKYSNNYGEDWFRALIFILCCWVIFFSLFVISRDGFGTIFFWFDISYLKEAINFLWLLNSSKDIESIRTVGQVLFFLLGKISIAYGIYQLIAAFRKHGK